MTIQDLVKIFDADNYIKIFPIRRGFIPHYEEWFKCKVSETPKEYFNKEIIGIHCGLEFTDVGLMMVLEVKIKV